jgi:hypothetical protein
VPFLEYLLKDASLVVYINDYMELSLYKTLFTDLPLVHLNYSLHLFFFLQGSFYVFINLDYILSSSLEVNYQLLTIDNFCLLLSILNLKSQPLTVFFDQIDLTSQTLNGCIKTINIRP